MIDFSLSPSSTDAQYYSVEALSVFSDGGNNESIGLEFLVDVDFTYLLIKDEIGELHKELASNYANIIVSRAQDAIKNEAIYVTFQQYFQARQDVEERFRQAVQKRWEASPSLHCELDQFHLGRIRIPESVATKQLQSTIQNERNDKEQFLQQAHLEREATAVEVNTINLERIKIMRTAEAQANVIRAKAQAEAERIVAQAQINGTRHLLESSNITTQDHKSAFTYLRTLRDRENLDVDVSYLSADGVLRTQPIG